ncbi:ABC transporter permease [Sorangium sp. So ce136]|uniref:ABC transporter permease n=1 Tax=Sorangium sp. So ce136 TaxID=3133284 RepID=UPI003F020E0A
MKLYRGISRRAYSGLAALSFSVFLGAWVALSRNMESAAVFLPSPLDVAAAGIALFRERDFAGDVLASIYRVTAGFAAAVAVALPVGLLAGTLKPVDAVVQPFNDFLRYLPVASLIPLSILWVGIGDAQKVAIIFVGTVFQLIPLVADTAARVPKHLVELGYTMGATSRQVLLRVVLPWCMPTLHDHFRVALGWAWSYLVVAELVAAASGIGHVIIQSQRFLQTGNVMASIVVIGVIGVLFDQLFRLSRRALFPWL